MAKKNPKTQRLRPKDRIDSFWVMINLTMPRYWKVTSAGIEKSSAPAAHQGPVLTFDDTSDFRYAASKKVSANDARAYFLTEYQEKCRVFSSSPTVYYGTPLARLKEFDHALFPGAYYMDMLLEKNKVELEQDSVVGFSLQVGGPDEFNIVVLFARRQNGQMSAPMVSLNPPDLDLTIREFADQHKANDTDPILYSVDDLLGLQVGTGYPVEDLVFGTSVQNLKAGAAVLLGVMTLVSAGLSGYQYTTAVALTEKASQQKERVKKINAQVETLVVEQAHAYARMNSVKTDKLFDYADSLWSKYSLVTHARVDRKGGVLKAYIPVQESVHDSSGRVSKKLHDFEDIRRILNRQPIGDLKLFKTTLSQDTNAYQVEYHFQSLDNDFSAIAGAK